MIHEAILPLLSVSSFALVYRAMGAPEQFIGFVIIGGAMTTFWLNILWSMGAQLYWERDSGNLELFIIAPGSMMAILAGMALGGLVLTFLRATIIVAGSRRASAATRIFSTMSSAGTTRRPGVWPHFFGIS